MMNGTAPTRTSAFTRRSLATISAVLISLALGWGSCLAVLAVA